MPVVPVLAREAALRQLVERIAQLRLPARVALDGIDAAGKTTMADELAERLPHASRVRADDFLRPAEERHRQGRDSPHGFYDDSFDHERLRAAVLAGDGLVIVDGIFLFRPDLNDLWDLRIFVHAEPEEALRRGVERDAHGKGSREEAERLYRTRYAPGQEIYFERVQPRELADIVVDNTDLSRLRVSLGAAAGRS